MTKLDPKQYNLTSRTVLRKAGRNKIAIVMDRKSRIVMKDGQSILEKVGRIKKAAPKTIVLVQTTAPVCSKTRAFLKEKGIAVQETRKDIPKQ